MFNEYTIEYAEDILMRDTELQSTRKIALMRYVPETKKILVIPENADNILVMDEDFKIVSRGNVLHRTALHFFIFIFFYYTLLQCSSRDIKFSISIYYLL